MRLRTGLAAVLFACAAGPSSAHAEPSQAEIAASKKAAIEIANKAFDAFTAGRYEDAIAGFQKAERKLHAPKFLLYVARSQAKLGKLVAAKSTYETIVREPLTSQSPSEFLKAQADARKELAELGPRIPTLQIHAKEGLTNVRLDGESVATDRAVSVDPGEHVLSARDKSFLDVVKKITIDEREAKNETLEPGPRDAGSGGSSGSASELPAASRPMPTGTYALYGIGAVTLILGGVLGGVTLATKSDYDRLKKAEMPDPNAINSAAKLGTGLAAAADISFLTGLTCVAVGTIVWATSRAPSPTGRTITVRPTAGGLSFQGTF